MRAIFTTALEDLVFDIDLISIEMNSNIIAMFPQCITKLGKRTNVNLFISVKLTHFKVTFRRMWFQRT